MSNDGVLGEAKVLTYFVEHGYDVFTQFAGKAPFDLAVYKDGIIYRVSVKSCTYKKEKAWRVAIGQGSTVRSFDSSKSDLLAIYIVPEDKILIFKSSDLHGKHKISIPITGAILSKAGRKQLVLPIEI